MIRKIVHIDGEKCTGCGACAEACHEGAIVMEDGRARLVRDDYCDGLGDCLPVCPAGAISIVERPAAPYDEAAVRAAGRGGCPGAQVRSVEVPAAAPAGPGEARPGRLANWPVQIKLVPASARFPAGAELLVAADCTAYACAAFHERFMAGRVTLVGCPKLDGVDYSEKLAAILGGDIKSVTLVRMEVPCCGGLEQALKKALARSGRDIPLRVYTVSVDGRVR